MNSPKDRELEKSKGQKTNGNRRCLYCGRIAPIVWVHGHGQCAACGINVEECCRGEVEQQ